MSCSLDLAISELLSLPLSLFMALGFGAFVAPSPRPLWLLVLGLMSDHLVQESRDEHVAWDDAKVLVIMSLPVVRLADRRRSTWTRNKRQGGDRLAHATDLSSLLL